MPDEKVPEVTPEEVRKFTPEKPQPEKVTKPAVGHFGQPEGVPQKKYRLSKWYQEYLGSEQRQRNIVLNPPSYQPTPPRLPNDTYKDMEGYDKLNATERWMAESLPAGIAKAKQSLDKFLPGDLEKSVYKAGEWVLKGLSLLDVGGEFVERGSGLVRQWKLADENDQMDEFTRNLGDAWAAGSMFYDTANAPMFNKGDDGTSRLTFHTDLPSTAELPNLRRKITELTDQGMERKVALEQVKAEYNQSLGALSIRAAKQDMFGHMLFDPFLIAQIMGYGPVTIVKNTAQAARTSKYPIGYIGFVEDAIKVASKADDIDEVARLTGVLDDLNKMDVITAGDKVAMFVTGQYPEPIAGVTTKADEILYMAGNVVATSDSKILKTWQRINPFSLTPEARYHEWGTRVDDYIGNHILGMSDDPFVMSDELTKLASQAKSGKVAAMAATPDGRVVQSFLSGANIKATELLNAYKFTAGDGQLVMRMSEVLDVKAPDLIESILGGKGDDIIRNLAASGDEGAALAQELTSETLARLGKLQGQPYAPELYKHILHNAVQDEIARVGIVKFGIKSKGLIHKWTQFMKAGETLAFLRMNPAFAAKNWMNNEFTLIAEGAGGGFFNRADDMAKLIDNIGYTPLRATEAFSAAEIAGKTVGEVGEEAARTIAKQIQGDAIWLDDFAKKINDVNLGKFDFGKISWKAEQAASQRALVKGYSSAWNKLWKPGGFTTASSFLPQEAIRELGEEVVSQLDNVLADARNINDIEKIFANIDKIDLNKSISGGFANVEQRIGSELAHQFEPEDLIHLQEAYGEALKAKTGNEVREIFDDLHKRTIDKITQKSDEMLQTKIGKFEQAVEGERSMALLDVTEEVTNQLDIAEYLYGSGMARFRPQDVTPAVRDTYWPIWLDQQNTHWNNVYNRIDAAVDGIRKGGKNIDLNLDQALKTIDKKKVLWNDFHEAKNAIYKASKEANWSTWDDDIEEVSRLYTIAADKDIALVKQTDDLMESVVRLNDSDLADGFSGWRKTIRDWKTKDRAQTGTYTYLQKKGELGTDTRTYSEFWHDRGRFQEELGEIKNRGYAMMEGNQEELVRFRQSFNEIVDTDTIKIYQGRPAKFDPAGGYSSSWSRDPSYAEGFAGKGGKVYTKEVTGSEWKKAIGETLERPGIDPALEAKARKLGIEEGIFPPEFAEDAKLLRESQFTKTLADDLAGRATTLRASQAMESELGPMFLNEAKEEQWFSRNFWTLRELEEEAMAKLGQPASRLDVSDLSKAELEKWFNSAKREMADAKYSSLRMAEFTRDSALLNYNRKMNYDTWLGTFMPYEFWMTHSLGRWAVRALNKPAMMSFYMRLRQLQDRVALEDDSFPARLRGKMRIALPGLPDWMGDAIYVDPLNIALPFGVMTMPYQLAVQRGMSNQGSMEREFDRMIRNEEITKEQADAAMAAQSGPLFNQVLATVNENAGSQTDNYQLLSALSSVHAPYDIGYKALTGQPENIGPFLPASFTVNRLLGMFGVDAPHEDANAPARIRRWMGLPGFDKWEDYRVERMLSNLSATGDITPEQANRAMITHEGPAWEFARQRAAKEFAGGPWWSTLLKTFGAPTYIYPTGEFLQRELGDDFDKAMQAYEDGDYAAYNEFFEVNPEFATRLSLWDEPQDRMRNFLVDDVWNIYSDLGNVDKRIVRESLGEEFVARFLNTETRNYEAIPIEQLQMWSKMMGGDPPGTLTEAFPIGFAPPEVGNQTQIFYDTRNENFPDFYEMQNEYFDLAEGTARKDYLRQTPQLKRYWDWRRDFLKRNPSIAAYIDDDFEPKYATVQEMRQATESEPTFHAAEFQQYLGTASMEILMNVYNTEFVPPPDIVEYLTQKAEELGMTYEELVEKVGTSR